MHCSIKLYISAPDRCQLVLNTLEEDNNIILLVHIVKGLFNWYRLAFIMCLTELRLTQNHHIVIRSAHISTHHEPDRNRNIVTTILKKKIQFSLL
jgi:hypothetical protein